MKYALKFVMLISISAFISISPFMTGRAEAGASEGDDAYRAGNYEKAIKEYKSCISSEGDTGKLSCWCSFMLGKVLLDKKQYSEAIPHLKRAADIDIAPGASCYTLGWRPAWYFWLGKAYYETQQFKDAIVAFEKAATLSADRLEQQMPNLQNFSPKDREYVLSMLPRKSSCYFWLGSTYYRNAQYQEAVNALKQAIDLDPTAINFYIDLASSYRELKQYDNAMAAVKRSIEIKPSDYAYQILATIYTAQKQYDEAIGAYKKSIEINPKNATLYLNIGNLFLQREDYSRAADNYKKAVELTPNDTRPLFALANTYRQMGRYDDAIESANKAVALMTITGVGLQIAIGKNYPVVQRQIVGESGLIEGPAKRAGIQVGDEIIRIAGQSTKGWDINKVIQTLRGAEGTQVILSIERKGLKEPIEKTVTRETIISKDAAPLFGLRSLAYREKGNLENAFKDAEKAYSLNLDDSWAKNAMSIAYIDKGKYNDALNILSTIKYSPFDRILEAIAQAKLGDMKKAVEIYSSIPEDYLATQSAAHQNYKETLMESLKPYVNARKDSAKSFEAKGQYREALKEYAELLKIANDRDAKEVRNHVALLIKNNPYLGELLEEARKYAVRGEALLKDGKFEESLNEFNSAIKIAPFSQQLYFNTAFVYGELKNYKSATRYMNIYIDLYPNAPNIRQVKDEIYKWELMMEKETEGK